MAGIEQSDVMSALRRVIDPERGTDVVSAGMVSGVATRDGNVQFVIEVEPERGARMEPLRKAAEKAVAAIPGVTSVTAVLTAQKPGANAPPQRGAHGAHGAGARGAAAQPALLPDVRAIVAVASGKGGVGKSTTAVNIALALAESGLRVGILDADIYGPSLPLLMGISERPKSADGKKLLPIERYGVKCMSIGFLVPADTPTIWR
jgi:ATP-binding protein involved in chromosome partitioning